MAANRPLQHLITTSGNPATRSSSSLVTPQLAALADPPVHSAVDPRLVHYLVAEAIRALVESERAAESRAKSQLADVEHGIAALRLHPAAADAPSADGDRPRTAVRARLDQIGYRVGWATAERLTRDRPRFPSSVTPSSTSSPSRSSAAAPPSGSSTPIPPPPPTMGLDHARPDVLELVKFVCKEVWVALFDKQVDNLRTNHRGVYVLSDLHLASLNGYSAVIPGQDNEDEEDRERLRAHVDAVLAFPSGVIRGALSNLDVECAVTGTADLATLPQASSSPTKSPTTTTTTTKRAAAITTTTTKKLIKRTPAPTEPPQSRPRSVNKYVPPPAPPPPAPAPAPAPGHQDRRPTKRARPSPLSRRSSSSPAAAVVAAAEPSSDLDPLTPSESESDSDLSSADEDYSSRTIRREDGAPVAVRNVAAAGSSSPATGGPVTSAESLVLQNPNAYRPYFIDPTDPQKPASDWAGSDIPSVELQYPGQGESSCERFALLAPKSDDEYNPIEDVMSVILTVLDHFLTPDQASRYFGHAPGKTAFSAFLYNRASSSSSSTTGGGGGGPAGSGRNSRSGTPLVPPTVARNRSPALASQADSPAQQQAAAAVAAASSSATEAAAAVATCSSSSSSASTAGTGAPATAAPVAVPTGGGDAQALEPQVTAVESQQAPVPLPPKGTEGSTPPPPQPPCARTGGSSGHGESLIRQLEKARAKSDGPAFLAALERYNETLLSLKRSGVVRDNVERMKGVRERVWTRVFTQCYDRAVGPGLDDVKKYRAFSDNVYGELLPKFMNEIFARTHLGPNSVFVDLGSGVGNCVVQAALATGAESWGFENMPHASQLARAQVAEAENRFALWGLSGGTMHVREADFCESPEVGAVLRRADVVLVNNEVFTSALNERLSWLFLELPPSAKIVSLKPFLASSFKLSSHNVHSPLAILAQYPPLRYTSNCVSWKPEGGTYFLARIDRGRVERFQVKERERERRREGEKQTRRERREGSAATTMSRTGSSSNYSSPGVSGGMSRTTSRQGSNLAR
ncbi:hypothetical protein JCM3774_005505 [Rhodotorula dairenensis]